MLDERFPQRPWRELWLGFDPATAHANLGPKRGIPTALLALAMTALVGSAWGTERFGTSSTGVWLTFTCWLVLCGWGMTGPDAFNRAGLPFAVLRASFLLSSVAYGSAFGATSRMTASPAYVMAFVMTTACAVFLIGRSRGMLALVAAIPLVERLLFVSAPSLASLAVAGLVGASLSVTARVVTDRLERDAAFGEGAEETVERARQVGAIARLAVLTSVHDGLSGLLLVARTRLGAAAELEELEPLIRQITLRGAELTRATSHPDLARAKRELEAVAETLGAAAEIHLQGDLSALPDDDREQLVELATEATLNALRAAPLAPIQLTLTTTTALVRFEARSRGQAVPQRQGGRGLAYARLRAGLRGGDAWVEPGPDFVLRVEWPRMFTRQRVGFPSIPVTLTAFLVPAVGLSWWQDAWAALGLSVYATLSAAVMFEQMRRSAREQEHRAREALARLDRDAPIRESVRSALSQPQRRLVDAWHGRSREAVAGALEAYAASIRRLLEAHEEPAHAT